MKERILSAICGIPAIILLAWAGGYYWMTLVVLMAFVGLYEFYRGARTGGHQPLLLAGWLVMIWALTMNAGTFSEVFGVAALLLSILLMVFLYPRYHIIDLAISWFGALYIGLLMGYIWKLSTLENHFWIILFAFLLTWASDTGAYFVGKHWGKRRLAPKLSPSKTWEGFVGGFLATILISLTGFWILPGFSCYHYISLGIAVGLAAPVGDLFASGIKRGFSIKDFGRLIPGHGGVLDRMDSFMCVAPLLYFFMLQWGG